MITIKNYIRVQSLEEAYELNQKKANRIIAGMIWMKTGKNFINTAIDMTDLSLDKIEETEDEFKIGPMVSLRQIELHKGLNEYTKGACKDALSHIVGVQLRNLATIGGSLWRRFGFSDVLSLFLSLNTFVQLYKGGLVPLSDFSDMEHDNDIITNIIVKKSKGNFVYNSMRNQTTDIPMITCALSNIEGTFRAVVGARPLKAVIIEDKDGILSNGITAESAKEFSNFVAEQVELGSNYRADKEYRKRLVRGLTERNALYLGGIQSWK